MEQGEREGQKSKTRSQEALRVYFAINQWESFAGGLLGGT